MLQNSPLTAAHNAFNLGRQLNSRFALDSTVSYQNKLRPQCRRGRLPRCSVSLSRFVWEIIRTCRHSVCSEAARYLSVTGCRAKVFTFNLASDFWRKCCNAKWDNPARCASSRSRWFLMEEQRVQIPVEKCNKMEKERREEKNSSDTVTRPAVITLFCSIRVYLTTSRTVGAFKKS